MTPLLSTISQLKILKSQICQTKTWTDGSKLLLKDQNLSANFEEILDILKLPNHRIRLLPSHNMCTIIHGYKINSGRQESEKGGGGRGGVEGTTCLCVE